MLLKSKKQELLYLIVEMIKAPSNHWSTMDT